MRLLTTYVRNELLLLVLLFLLYYITIINLTSLSKTVVLKAFLTVPPAFFETLYGPFFILSGLCNLSGFCGRCSCCTFN